MLGAGLIGQEHHLLGAYPLGVDIGHDLQTDGIQLIQIPVHDLHVRLLGIGQYDTRFFIHSKGFFHLCLIGTSLHFAILPYFSASKIISFLGFMPSIALASMRLHAAAADANSSICWSV